LHDFQGKVAVITGAASGIGLAMARRFATEGMDVVMSDVEHDALAGAVGSVEALGARVLPVLTDVADPAAVQALAERSVAAFGKVHVLCANAGVSRGGSPWDHSLDDWKWILGVNLWGVIHCLRAFVPLMKSHGEEGHVVMTSSAVGLVATTASAYVTSKYAVVGLAESLAVELGPEGRIGVSVLCPGGVKTRIFTSERNRPSDLAQQGRRNLDVEKSVADRADNAAPEYIAEIVAKAIRERQFYILPMQPRYGKSIRKRLARLLEALDSAPGVGT
jgi:NAD(P)-dependent dehydrogenase (short-subunit alcohol dehydrogenase family)